MIPDAAVEAAGDAVKAFYEGQPPRGMRAAIRAALEAAAPRIAAGIWESAYRRGVEDERKAEGAGRNFEPSRPNPYRPTP